MESRLWKLVEESASKTPDDAFDISTYNGIKLIDSNLYAWFDLFTFFKEDNIHPILFKIPTKYTRVIDYKLFGGEDLVRYISYKLCDLKIQTEKTRVTKPKHAIAAWLNLFEFFNGDNIRQILINIPTMYTRVINHKLFGGEELVHYINNTLCDFKIDDCKVKSLLSNVVLF